ncbi:MAG: hypothetical protein QXD44_05275 [Candidatus Nezhaarchaeales archaeon]
MSMKPTSSSRSEGVSYLVSMLIMAVVVGVLMAAVVSWGISQTFLGQSAYGEAITSLKEKAEEKVVIEHTWVTPDGILHLHVRNVGLIPVSVDAVYVNGTLIRVEPPVLIGLKNSATVNVTLPSMEAGYALITLATTRATMVSDYAYIPRLFIYTYYPSSYNVTLGSYLSGNLDSLRYRDLNYLVVKSAGTTTSSTPYNPSSYTILNGSLKSGTIENARSNDGNYITFESATHQSPSPYNPTGYSVITGTWLSGGLNDVKNSDDNYMVFESAPVKYLVRALLAYRSATGSGVNYPKVRVWNGIQWEEEQELASAESEVRWVRVATHPWKDEKIVVTLSADRYLDAYVWNGATWTKYSNLGRTETYNTRCFDIVYEQNSGRAILVYSYSPSSAVRDLAYRIWTGSSWLLEQYINDPYTSDTTVYWVSLAAKPGSNEVGLVYTHQRGSDRYVRAWIWNGTSWGNSVLISYRSGVSGSPKEICALAYEQASKRLVVTGVDYYPYQVAYAIWTGSSWSGIGYVDPNPDLDDEIFWLTLKADPASNRIMLTCVDGGNDLSTALWSGSAWSLSTRHEDNVETVDRRCADGDWEPTLNRFVLAWGVSLFNDLRYRVWDLSTGWGSINSLSGFDPAQHWVQARGCPLDEGIARVMFGVIDGANDLTMLYWDGNSLGNLFKATEVVDTYAYECFEVEYERFRTPIKQEVSVEFRGSSNTSPWSVLKWTVEAGFNVSSVNVTLQLYDYSAGGYPSSGDGYIHYTGGTVDEVKWQLINMNPTRFRDATGNWKLKITAIKQSSEAFQLRVDWVEYKPTVAAYVAEVVFEGVSNTYTWTQLNWLTDLAFNVSSVDVTLQLYDYSAGGYPSSGDGYIHYTSGPPNQDETRNQTILTSPERFRNATGGWRLKVKAVKDASFELKVDWVKYEPTYYTRYEVTVDFNFTNVTPPFTPGKLTFKVVSKYSLGSVNTVIQAWDYSLNGWSDTAKITYESADPPADEVKLLTITSDVGKYLRNGEARLRIHGVKDTAIRYDLLIDEVELKVEK